METEYNLYCKICGKKFKTIQSLRNHYSKTHSAFRHIENKQIVYENSLTNYQNGN